MPARAIKHIGNKTKSRIQSKRRNEVGRGKDRLLSAGVFENGRGNASVTKKSTLARGLSPRKEPVLNLRASATNRDIRKKRAEEKKKKKKLLSLTSREDARRGPHVTHPHARFTEVKFPKTAPCTHDPVRIPHSTSDET